MEEKVQKISVDRQWRIQESFGDLLPHHLDEHIKIGQQLQRRLHALGWQEPEAALEQAMTAGKSTTGEIELGDPALVLHWRAEPWINGEHVGGAILTVLDITWEKRQQRQREISSRLNHMAQFAHQIVHRVNTPLAAVLNRIGCLIMESEAGGEWPRIRAELSAIQEEIYTLSLITHALDAFSREEGGGGKLVQLNSILEKALEVSRLIHAPKGVQLVARLSREWLVIYGHEIALEQCFLNLLRNAIEASPEGGEVTVTTAISGSMAMVTIQDQGSGIAAGALERVFEPFYTTDPQGHLGLGLSISHSIAVQFQGELELESQPGAGTTARLLFPLAKNLVKKG